MRRVEEGSNPAVNATAEETLAVQKTTVQSSAGRKDSFIIASTDRDIHDIYI